MITITEQNIQDGSVPVPEMTEYRKTKNAFAVRIDDEFSVETLEGVMTGKAGDYLMKGAHGELYPCAAAVFEDTYEDANTGKRPGEAVTRQLDISDTKPDKKNIDDLVMFGDTSMLKLLCKASSQKEGFMKSTKAMEIPGVGCVVQATTQQRNPDGSYAVAEALTLVPGAIIEETINDDKEVVGRKLALSADALAMRKALLSM